MMETLHYLQHHLPPLAFEVFRLSVWLVLLTVIFVPLERIFALHRQKIARKAIWTDLAYYFLNSILPGIVLAVPVALIAAAAHRFMPYRIHTLVGGLPGWAQVSAFFVVSQIGFYWGHRWSHEVPLLWRFHAVHHSAPEIDWLVNTRAHPVDMIFTRFCGIAPIYLLGLTQTATPAAIILIGTVWGFFIHANVRWRFGWLEWLVATPAFHHWHHSRTDHPDHNYAAILPFLDVLFATYYTPPRAWPEDYGINAPMPGNIAGQLLEPILA